MVAITTEHHCHKCDNTRPVKLRDTGVHVNATCGNCGFYVKFIPKGEVPFFLESKNKIWALTKDVDFIQKLKKEIGLHDDLKGLAKNIYYHNLYVEVINRAFT